MWLKLVKKNAFEKCLKNRTVDVVVVSTGSCVWSFKIKYVSCTLYTCVNVLLMKFFFFYQVTLIHRSSSLVFKL